MMPINARTIASALGAVALLSLGALSLDRLKPYPEAASIGTGVTTFAELSDRFASLAKKKGGAYAFEILRRAMLPPNTDLHLLGHTVGDELYKEMGPDGISVCTQEFRNACSHSIVIGMLNEFGSGDGTIAKIHDACAKAPGGSGAYTMCFHGLGHGVFAYFGYDIPKTVAFCKRLGTKTYHDQEYPQCVGGMIMELIGGGGHDRDAWTVAHAKYLTADPLAPCDTDLIPSDAKSMCYTYLTPWLFVSAGADLGNPDPSTFSKAFSFCNVIRDPTTRHVCYGGLGKEFIPIAASRDIRSVDSLSDDAYQKAIGWCMLGNDEARLACVRQELESIFWGGENDPEAAFRFCSLATNTAMRSACYDELSYVISFYLSGERKTELCQRLPDGRASACLKGTESPRIGPASAT